MKRTQWRLRAVIAVSVIATLSAALLAPTAHASTAPSRTTAGSWATSMFTKMNQQRAANGLPAYRWNADLARAAHAHNMNMEHSNTLSHQLPGEGSLGARLHAVGYNWSACGENIAYTTGSWTQSTALSIEDMFYNERAPNDAHRRNILSTTFRDVGIDIVFDGMHNKMWITEDFGRSF